MGAWLRSAAPATLQDGLRAAKSRVAVITTGFPDRTLDEIRTAMAAGPMRTAMSTSVWRAGCGGGRGSARDVGDAGPHGREAGGKGGASGGGGKLRLGPSPTAAVLHATHHQRTDAAAVQGRIAAGGARATLDQPLTPPPAGGADWSAAEMAEAAADNVQDGLGHVIRGLGQVRRLQGAGYP